MNKKLIAIILIVLAVAAVGFYVNQADAATCPTPAEQQGTDFDWKTFQFWTSDKFTYDLMKALGFNIELRQDVPAPDSQPEQPAPAPQPKPGDNSYNQDRPSPHYPNPTGLNADEQKMFDLVNKERVANGLKPLEIDMRLVETARLKSDDMVKLGYFDHNSPTYGSPFDMMKKYGITYTYAAENLAGAPDVNTAHVNLMNSPGHRANILRAEFTHVGIGVVEGSRYGKIFTQQFIKK